ncbi:unnamed protein product [Sphenostylis stenocarpa]|uniref:Uncharacterized protein n=1 Tax=Sphenostylis stenocarpa TaxID=92480 RepID=A0AA86SHF6_9FABA|nr:unnamed protein product [Sphenostylis stenocarpa]
MNFEIAFRHTPHFLPHPSHFPPLCHDFSTKMTSETPTVPLKEEEVHRQVLMQFMTNKEVVLAAAAAATISGTVTAESGENDAKEKGEVEEEYDENGKDEVEKEDVERRIYEVEKENGDTVKLYFNPSDAILRVRNGPAIGIAMLPTEEEVEVYFKRMFNLPPNHEFYCPRCKACIDKVLFCPTRPEPVPSVPVPPVSVPPVTVPPVTVPSVQVPPVTVPPVSVPPATVPPVSVPQVTAPPVPPVRGPEDEVECFLRDLKASKPGEAREEEGSEREAEADKYTELLGKRENFYLHAFFAFLSFLIFGLVPPVVYGFSFGESGDKDLKLAAVAGASLICITLLAIAKDQSQRPNNTFITFFKTVTFYVTSGVLASLLTYVAGAQINKLIQHLGWFQPNPESNFSLSLPHHLGVPHKSGWGSY